MIKFREVEKQLVSPPDNFAYRLSNGLSFELKIEAEKIQAHIDIYKFIRGNVNPTLLSHVDDVFSFIENNGKDLKLILEKLDD